MANEVNKKYQIDTEENKQFLRENTETLLAFGHKFPSPGGGSYYLGNAVEGQKQRNMDHLSHGTCVQSWCHAGP